MSLELPAVAAGHVAGDGEILAHLAGYERERGRQPLVEALLETRSGDAPPDVRDAADRLLRVHAPWALDLATAADRLLREALDERRLRLLTGWTLRPDGRSQLQLAAEEGVSGARIGQILRDAEQRVRRAVDGAPAPLPWAVRTLRQRLGSVTTRDRLAASLTELGARETPAAELMPWLAGPYSVVPRRPNWLAVEPQRVVARTAECLAADGGVRRMVDVECELADLGIAPGQLGGWLAANGVSAVHELAVLVTGPLGDAAERLLDAHGEARTVEQLSADIAAGGRAADEAALVAALRGRRFVRTVTGAVRLASWDEAEDRRLEGKPAAGKARPRPRSRAGTLAEPGAGKGSAATRVGELLWLWVRVDAEVLRGSEAPVPASLVERLGLVPPGRRTFASRWGPVTLAHEGRQPTRGSVRAVALALGAKLDDTLLLGFSAAGDLVVELRCATGQAVMPGSDQTVPSGDRDAGDVLSAELAPFPQSDSGGTR